MLACVAAMVNDQMTSNNQTTLQGLPFKVNAVGAVFVPFQVPLKPGDEASDCPAGMEPLYEALVTVTVLPLWV